MKYRLLIATALMLLSMTPTVASAQTQTVILPSSDGTIATCDGCGVTDLFLTVGGIYQGVAKFSTKAIPGAITQALFTLSPAALPALGPTVDVYGYGTDVPTVVRSDMNAGSFLGTIALPQHWLFNDVVYFDVTDFVSSTRSPYLAFNLRSSGIDSFNSLKSTLQGHPEELLITSVPEVDAYVLMLAGLGVLGVMVRCKKHNTSR